MGSNREMSNIAIAILVNFADYIVYDFLIPGICLFIECSSLSLIPSWLLSDISSSYLELLINLPGYI